MSVNFVSLSDARALQDLPSAQEIPHQDEKRRISVQLHPLERRLSATATRSHLTTDRQQSSRLGLESQEHGIQALAFVVGYSLLLRVPLFSSFIQTNLVTISKVLIIECFDQILETPGLKPKWLTYDPSVREWEQRSGGKMHDLWLKSMPRPEIEVNVKNGVEVMQNITESKIVILGDRVVVTIAHSAICLLARRFKLGPIVLRSTIEEEAAVLKASSYNELMDQKLAHKISHRFLLSDQSLFLEHVLSESIEAPDEASAADVRDCKEGVVREAPHPVVVAKSVAHFDSLFLISGCLFFVATLVLGIEVVARR